MEHLKKDSNQFTEAQLRSNNRRMSSGRVFRFGPGSSTASEQQANHLFVFLHGCGATAQSMIPIAFRFQARFPSAAMVVPSGFDPEARGGAVLPDVEDLVRREQTHFSVPANRTVLIGFSQGGTVALEAVKAPNLA